MDPQPVRHSSSQFPGARGALLHLHEWTTPEEPAATIAVVHGYGEHGGRYAGFAEALTPRGYAVYAYDLRGHGHSSGDRGQIGRFADYLDDTGLFLDLVRERRPAAPVFLLGHSLGGLIAARFVEERPKGLQGVVLSSPFLRLKYDVPATRKVGAKVLSAVWPGRDIGNTVRAEELSHEQSVVSAYITDPLVHHVARARWAAETLAAQETALAAAGSITLPLLLAFAGADEIADPAASRELFAAASSADKTMREYEGYFHEIFNETGREQVFDDVAAWLGERAGAAAG